MSYSNTYPTTLPGIGEAVLDALRERILASVEDLNLVLTRDSLTPNTVFTVNTVVIGDLLVVRHPYICVFAGDENGANINTEDFTMPILDNSGRRHFVKTTIAVYLPFSANMTPSGELEHSTRMERTLARVADHLRRRVFNTQDALSIPLESREFAANPASGTDYDVLRVGKIQSVRYRVISKGFGSTVDVYAALLTHIAQVDSAA